MSKNVRKKINEVLEQPDDKILMLIKQLSTFLIHEYKVAYKGTQHFGETDCIMSFDLPIHYRRFTGADGRFEVELSLYDKNGTPKGRPTQWCGVFMMADDTGKTTISTNKQPFKNLEAPVKEAMENFLHVVKSTYSDSYKKALN